jgi:hypothetical protein
MQNSKERGSHLTVNGLIQYLLASDDVTLSLLSNKKYCYNFKEIAPIVNKEGAKI